MASGGVARHEACRAGGRPRPAVFLPADPGPGIHRSPQATSGKPVWDGEEVTGARAASWWSRRCASRSFSTGVRRTTITS